MRGEILLHLLLIFFTGEVLSQNDTIVNPDIEKTRAWLRKHNYVQALNICNSYLKSSQQKNERKNHSIFLGLKGFAYLDTLDADSAKLFFEKSLSEAYGIGYKEAIKNSLYGLGKFYYRNSNYKTSIKYFQLLSYYSQNDKNYELISNYYLSANYNLVNMRQLSILHGRRAATAAFDLKDTSSYIKSLLSIGTQFFVMGNIDSTEFYIDKANKVYENFNQKYLGIGADIYGAFLKIQLFKKNYDKGIYYARQAIKECMESKEYYSLNIYYDNLAICFTSKKMYDSATAYYEKAIDLELQYNYVDEYKTDLKELFYINKLANKPKKALEYIEKYITADSLYQKAKENAIDSLKTAFEFEKSRITLKADEEKLQQAYERKQIFYLSVGIILLLLLTVIPYLIYLRKMINREKEKQNLLIQVKDSEIKALQSQMNPHFIFNSLNSVLEFISGSEIKEAIKYLTKFSRLIRMVLEFSNRKSILLSEEIELLKIYVDLENIRSKNGFVFTVNVDDDIDTNGYDVHPMLLQPFIENSIIHGVLNKMKLAEIEKKEYKGVLKLDITRSNGSLKCVIEDNGIGRKKAQEIKNSKSFNHVSLGMRITSDRLELLSENECKIEYFDLKNNNNEATGTRIEILIPLLENF
jgi:tetratricopeptide (TPR) repeat protein